MSVKERPLTAAERKVLLSSGSAARTRGTIAAYGLGSLFLCATLFAVISLILSFLSGFTPLPTPKEVKWWLFFSCIFLVGIYVVPSLFREFRRGNSLIGFGKRFDADLDGGMAAVEMLDVNEVYEIEEFDDEGAGFLLVLSDGRVLCLISQDLYPYSLSAAPEDKEFADTVFPSTRIEHTYAPHSGSVFSTKGLGDYLKPKALLRWPEGGPRTDPYLGPEPDTFMDGPVDDIIKRAGFLRVDP